MDHRGVIFATELETQFWKRGLHVFAAKIHGDLTGNGESLEAPGGFEFGDFDIIMVRH
jgi:hypothetical protein